MDDEDDHWSTSDDGTKSDWSDFQVDYDALVASAREFLEGAESQPPTVLASCLLRLALAMRARYEHSKGLDDLRELISLFQRYVSLASEDALAFNHLGDALNTLYERTNELAVCENTITAYRKALHSFPEDNIYYKELLAKLSIALGHRFSRTGFRNDIDEALSLDETALALCPDGHPHRDVCLSNLASTCSTRFRSFGAVEDLERCILYTRQALGLRPADHLSHRTSLHELGMALDDRYSLYRHLPDLEQAIKLYEQALPLYSDDDPKRNTVLSALASALIERFRRPGRPPSLNRAISLLREAINRFEGGPRQLSAFYLNLSAAYDTRYEHFRDAKDLDEAIAVDQKAVRLLPRGHSLRATALVTSAVSLDKRFVLSGQVSDAIAALKVTTEGLETLRPGNERYPWAVLQLAELHLTPGTPYFDLKVAVNAISTALGDPLVIAQCTLEQVTRVLNLLRLREPWKAEHFGSDLSAHIIRAYQLLLALLPRIAYFGLDLKKRLHMLEYVQGSILDGASYALLVSRPQLALEMLEEGRGVFWTQALRLRMPFDNLPPDLAQELCDASRQLERLSQGPLSGTASCAPSEDDSASSARRLTEQFETLLSRARDIPGFEQHMHRGLGESLARAAERGHVVVLVASGISCHAVIIKQHSDGPQQVVLPGLTAEHLNTLSERLRSANKSGRDISGDASNDGRDLKKVNISANGEPDEAWSVAKVLRELWEKVAKLIIDALGIEKLKDYGLRPRLWWCATGAFAFLPIHAAGMYTPNHTECCSDYVVSSYTPTLTALLDSQRRSPHIVHASMKVLLAAVPNPSHHGSRWTELPSTVDEANAVRSVMPAEALISLPPDEDCTVNPANSATADSVIERLPEAHILHLACHGHQDSTDPLQSGFAMRDSMLIVHDLMKLNLPHAYLAFLSACETAKGDRTQPDQTVHLAAAMLFTGFRSVIATMWPMNDHDGPEVASAVYTGLLGGGKAHFNIDDIPLAVDSAVRKLREKGVHPSRWATFVHLGL